jgi:pilus assembly protein Flp/PilA
MRRFSQAVWTFVRDDDGPTAVEYAFLAVLVLAVCLLAVVAVGRNTNQVMSNDANKITQQSSGS